MNISIIIPVYKNKELFLKMLEANYQFLKPHQIIIVDDYSQNNLKHDIKALYKDILVIENDKNLGFSESVNRGVAKASSQYLLLLNSDVKLHDKTFETVVSKFTADPHVFACSFAQIEKNGTIVGRNKIYFNRGLIMHGKANKIETGISAWAEGGASIIRKKYFDELHGFDTLYSPFYWEDIDLSYRAYKREWQVFFDPSVVVEHHHESTIGKYYKVKNIKTIAYRNQFIFMWKNITDGLLIAKHICWLPCNILYYGIFKGEIEFVKGFFLALRALPAILNRRLNTKRQKSVSDNSIFTMFKTI